MVGLIHLNSLFTLSPPLSSARSLCYKYMLCIITRLSASPLDLQSPPYIGCYCVSMLIESVVLCDVSTVNMLYITINTTYSYAHIAELPTSCPRPTLTPLMTRVRRRCSKVLSQIRPAPTCWMTSGRGIFKHAKMRVSQYYYY